jgi:hypothetical protein
VLQGSRTEAAHDKKGRDKNGGMLHNLASLLMNTTLHQDAASCTKQVL